MCAVYVSPAFEGWPIFILCGAGMQRREGRLTEKLRSFRLPFHVVETIRGANPVEGRPELHRRVWRQILRDDLPGAVLLEDGARLLPGFVGFLAAGGYLHAELTQLCHGRARVWRWGGGAASPGVRLRPLAASDVLPAGYALSRNGARHLLDASRARRSRCERDDDHWPCDVARLGAMVARPQLVEAPEWMLTSDPADGEHGHDHDSAAARKAPSHAHLRLRQFAREHLSLELPLHH